MEDQRHGIQHHGDCHLFCREFDDENTVIEDVLGVESSRLVKTNT
jgi:hypothetical protein